MNDDDYADGPRIQLVLAAVFLLVVAGGVADLILDRPTTLFSIHILFEVGLVLVSLSAATYLARGWYRAQVLLAESERESERRDRERVEWQTRAGAALEGLGAALAVQFEAWSLTAAERRTALMLLKGLSHKRIARITGTSERTVRQHAVAVYRKSGLAGRAELAGFFLEALALPEDLAG
jgi:DNA-binding CsgD family transcriptional regulator